MIKVIAILFLVYFFFRSIGYVLRILLGQGKPAQQAPGRGKQFRQQPKGSNLNVERPPQPGGYKSEKKFDDGEYIDYEEVE